MMNVAILFIKKLDYKFKKKLGNIVFMFLVKLEAYEKDILISKTKKDSIIF